MEGAFYEIARNEKKQKTKKLETKKKTIKDESIQLIIQKKEKISREEVTRKIELMKRQKIPEN